MTSDPIGMFAGMQVIVSEAAVTKERLFPESKHRSRRVHKKLVKRFGGEFRRVPAAFMVGGRAIMHPDYYAELRRRTDDQ